MKEKVCHKVGMDTKLKEHKIAVSATESKLQKSLFFPTAHYLSDVVKTLWKIGTYFSIKCIPSGD